MTEIKFWGGTFVGTAEGDHGVFTDSDGTVFAGQIAGDFACVGVATWTDGGTSFVECDADGKEHGRWLDCYADGDTVYRRWEHGSGANERGAAAEGCVIFQVGPSTAAWSGARGQGWAFGGGLNVLRGLGQPQGTNRSTSSLTTLRRLGVSRHAPTEVSALPRVHLHLDPIFVGSHNSISGARRNL
jgi:hypothetical protein